MNYRSLHIALLLAFGCSLALSQGRWQGLEVSKIRFEGNETFRDDALLEVMQTKESPASFWKFMYKISEKLGDKPEYFDRLLFEHDYARLQAFYKDQGFFSARIDTLLRADFSRAQVKATVTRRVGGEVHRQRISCSQKEQRILISACITNTPRNRLTSWHPCADSWSPVSA